MQGGVVTLYLDGAKLGTKPLSNALVAPNNAFAINGPAGEYVDFDELAVYDYALSDEQVARHYACGYDGNC